MHCSDGTWNAPYYREVGNVPEFRLRHSPAAPAGTAQSPHSGEHLIEAGLMTPYAID